MLLFPPAALLLVPLFVGTGRGTETPGEIKSGIAIWDSGRTSKTPLSPGELTEKKDWLAIPAGKTAVPFKGDAILGNGRIIAVFRQQDGSLEIHPAKSEVGLSRLRIRLQTLSGEPAARLERVALIESSKNAVAIEAFFTTARGERLSGRFRIKRGDVTVQVDPGVGAGKLRVECPGRFVILPDFFADDITLDATKLPLSAADLPSENFVLHLTGDGAALALCVFENRQQDVKVTLAGNKEQRHVTGSEIVFEGKKVWVALVEAPQIWHVRELDKADARKVIPLDWTMPFPAQWRVDFARPGDLTDSWEMLLQDKKDGPYIKPSWLGSGEDSIPATRKRWNTVLGTYPYPCWSDAGRQGFLQPLERAALHFVGPAIIYPIHRVKDTPLDAYTVVDIMRNTLGVGPCEHILDREGHQSEYKGRATCAVRDKLTPIYASGQQKKLRPDVDKTLDEGLTFVKHIRGRINRYVEFGTKMRQYLSEQKKIHPELADFIAEMDQLNQQIDTRVAARAAKIKTPEHVAQMNAEFRKNVLDYDGPDAVLRCLAYNQALVTIGDNQDELAGECRWVVKTLRQRAGVLLALDPRVGPIASEIRTRTQEALRNPAIHEGARH